MKPAPVDRPLLQRFAFAFLLFMTALAVSPAVAANLEVTYLANEGFLLKSGDSAVLIDAFVTEPYSNFAFMPEEVASQLVSAAAPFDDIDIALVSHMHRDHFQPKPAAKFLAASKETVLASSRDVVDALQEQTGTAGAERVFVELPKPGERSTRSAGDVRVEFLRLSHGSGRFASIQNLGHIIHLGGKTVLHLGDAARDADNFAAYDLPEREIDIAILPYWYFETESGRQMIRDHLHARHTIAAHIPPAELEKTRAGLRERFPKVVVLGACLDSQSFD